MKKYWLNGGILGVYIGTLVFILWLLDVFNFHIFTLPHVLVFEHGGRTTGSCVGCESSQGWVIFWYIFSFLVTILIYFIIGSILGLLYGKVIRKKLK